eukprot:g2261.t2
MSWAEPADMDTLSELPPASVSVGKMSLSRASSVGAGRSSKSSRRVGGASKSERRLLMEAKAGVGAAIAEALLTMPRSAKCLDRQERLIAKRRARKCVRFLYYVIKVVGVAACVFTSGLNLALVYMRPDFRLQNRLVRSYLVAFGIGGVLAELDTPFAKANFRALQKWWFKAPFYVFMAWLCFDPAHSRGSVWFYLELASFVALQAMAVMAVVLNVCLREVLERSGALGKRRGKKSSSSSSRRRRRGIGSSASSRGGGSGGGAGGARVANSSSGGLGVSSFRERDRRRPSRPPLSSPTSGIDGFGGGGADNRHAPEMVPERSMSASGRLLSPTPSSGGYSGYGGGGYGTVEGGGDGGVGGGGGGGGLGGGISGKIKWWLDRGGAEEGGSSPRGGGRAVGGTSSPASPVSVSTARSGRTNWWEDSDGDDGASSLASFAQSDAISDAGSSVSGMSTRSGATWMTESGGGGGGGRYGSSGAQYAGRGAAPLRRAASVASSSYSRGSRPSDRRRRFGGSGAGSVRGGLEQRPPPLTMQAGAASGGGEGAAEGEGGFAAVLAGGGGEGDEAHVALTAQALARNSNEALPPTGRGPTFGGGGGINYGGSVAGSSVNGGRNGGGGSLHGFGTRRSGSRRPPSWEAGGPSRAASVSGDGLRGAGAGAGPAWAQGAADCDVGRTASEAGDNDRAEDGRHPRAGANSRRTPGTQDYSPF